MDDDTRREPDHTEDPRDQDTGRGGYPESNPAGAHDDDAAPGPAEHHDHGDGSPAPSTSRDDR